MKHLCVRPTIVPVEPTFELLQQGSESCPVCSSGSARNAEPIVLFRWLRFPRLVKQKGLATGIIGLW